CRVGKAARSAGTARAFGRRSRRHVFRAGEYCALSVARSRVGVAQDEPQIQAPLSMDGRAPARERPRAAAGVDGRIGNPMARSEAAGKTGVTGAISNASTGT